MHFCMRRRGRGTAEDKARSANGQPSSSTSELGGRYLRQLDQPGYVGHLEDEAGRNRPFTANTQPTQLLTACRVQRGHVEANRISGHSRVIQRQQLTAVPSLSRWDTGTTKAYRVRWM